MLFDGCVKSMMSTETHVDAGPSHTTNPACLPHIIGTYENPENSTLQVENSKYEQHDKQHKSIAHKKTHSTRKFKYIFPSYQSTNLKPLLTFIQYQSSFTPICP